MSEHFSAQRTVTALESVHGYLKDLLDVDFEDFQTKLRLFVNACEMDDIVRHFVWLWHGAQKEAMAWYQARSVGSGADLPETEPALVALAYSLLFLASRRRIEPRSLIVTCFEGGTSINDKFEHFKEELVGPFAEGLSARINWMHQTLAPDESLEIEEFAYQLLNQFDREQGIVTAEPAKESPAGEEAAAAEPAPAPETTTTSGATKPAPAAKAREQEGPRRWEPSMPAAIIDPEKRGKQADTPETSTAPASGAAPATVAAPPASPAAATTAKTAPARPAEAAGSRWEADFEALQRMVGNAGWDARVKEDRQTDVLMLKLELSKNQPDLLRMKDLLRDLESGSDRLRQASRELMKRIVSEL